MSVTKLSGASRLFLIALCLYQIEIGLCNPKNFLKFAHENLQVKGFTVKEPADTPEGVVDFIDTLPYETFNLLDEICLLSGKKPSTSAKKRREVLLEETIVQVLIKHSLLDSIITASHTLPYKMFETFWKKEFVRPCHKIIRTHDDYWDELPSSYNLSHLRHTRIGALLRFEEMCRDILKKTSPETVHEELSKHLPDDHVDNI